MAKRTTRDLIQAREFPVGRWLSVVADATNGISPGELLAAAVYRINIADLIAKSDTYIGLPGEMNSIAAALSSEPSELNVLVLSDRSVQVTLGGLGWRPGGTFRQAKDWQVRLTVSDDLKLVLLEVTDASTTDDALNNAKAFKAFCGALGDVLLAGVALTPVAIGSSAELNGHVASEESITNDWAEIRVAEPLPVSEEAYAAINWSFIDGWISDKLKSDLVADRAWPLVAGEPGDRRTNVTTPSSIDLFGEVLSMSFIQAEGAAKDNLRELGLALQSATSIEVMPSRSSSGIDTNQRMLPFAVTADVSRLLPVAFLRMCGTRCHATSAAVSFMLRRQKHNLALYGAATRNRHAVVCGFHGEPPRGGLFSSLAEGMLPQWSVDSTASGRTRPLSTQLTLSGLTFTRTGAMPGSDQLLELLGTSVDSLCEEESLRVWMLDRHSDYRPA